MLAALSHDVGHMGVTNRFLVITKADLATTYNDISVLENMHCATLFEMLKDDSMNILGGMESDEWVNTRKIITDMILITDMSKHFDSLGTFRTRALIQNDITIDKFEDRLFVLKMGLKCADLGHSAKNLKLH